MIVEELEIPDVKRLTPRRNRDSRGFLTEVWRKEVGAQATDGFSIVQENHSFSESRGTVRGLHFQIPPRDQAKLILVVTGAIFDVAVDIRGSSPHFGKHVTATLTAEEGTQLFVPSGFAHGFCTLTDNTHIIYRLSAPYSPDHDAGVHWQDPDLAIDWPDVADELSLSERDRALPRLVSLPAHFT